MKLSRCLCTCAFALAGSTAALATTETSVLRAADNATVAGTTTTETTAAATSANAATNTANNVSAPIANAVPPLTLPVEGGTPTGSSTTNISQTTNTTQAAPTIDPNATLSVGAIPGITTNVGETNSKATQTSAATAKPVGSDIPYSLDGVPAFNPIQALAVTTLFLAAFAMVGYSIVRARKGKNGNSARQEKPMEVLSTMPIGPKRQIMIVRIRNQEIVIASTENGITMLTDIADKNQRPMLADMRPLNQIAKQTSELMLNARDQKEAQPTSQDDTNSRKSEFLLKALNNLKEKKNAKPSQMEMDREPEVEPRVETKQTRTPALSANKNGFNKFFANAFEQEASRNIAKPGASKGQQESEESVENVTKLIREKLKNMQPAGN